MMDIAYVTAAVFDILTGFLRTWFSGDVHYPKKDSCWCKYKHRKDDIYDKNYGKNSKAFHICCHKRYNIQNIFIFRE